MKVSLLKKDKKVDFILPENIFGSYWISDIDTKGVKKNLISIEAFNNSWKLVSNTDIFYMENELMQPYKILENNKFYTLKNKITNKTMTLYSYNTEQRYNSYDISNMIDNGVLIGNTDKCSIVYPYLEKEDFILKKENNNIYIINNNPNKYIYVNNVVVKSKQILKMGDVVFAYGLMFFYYKCLINGQTYYYLSVNNIDNMNVKCSLMQAGIKRDSSEFQENEEIEEIELYTDGDYFHKVPRFIPSIKQLNLNVDAPPSKEEEQNSSVLLTVGPMITMSMTSMVTGYTAINNVLSGTSTWARALPSLVMCGAMFASMFIWPTITRHYEKKSKSKKEKLRQQKYGSYIESKRNDIINAKNEQSKILNNNYPSSKECQEIILNKYTTLWQRRIKDEDYLVLNLGLGSYPMKIDIRYPDDHFSMAEDNLKDMVQKLGNEPKLLANVPVIYSLLKNYISGIVGNNLVISNYFKQLLIQIITHHSYDNLKIVIFTDDEKQANWNFIKDLPHLFTDDKELRFFATNNDEYKEICYYLDRLSNARKETKINVEDVDKIYLIITDSFKAIRNFDIIQNILNSKENMGFSLLILDNKITDLPDQCKAFIEINENGELHEGEYYIEPLKFNYEINPDIDYEACVSKLANIPIEIQNDQEGQLPEKLTFLEMFEVGKIEQLNSLMRWQKNNPMMSLQADVGLGKNGEKISIDLHEKFHGPHGLIAGSTGSGKSEFIISYILSMAINYHPHEVQFILIDYKGGGLAGAFENESIGLKLPHLVGTITNLDLNEIKRSLASIESELRRRQSLFNKAREATGESTIDIYKYQKMYREGIVEEPVSHLFIISDEFAELKTQQPEFMAQLISTARIGRSLGVHLILATQKPSGVVDPQIWSNTRFRVCMRVQEKSDSNEVIKCPDAAFLKHTGRFYFQVGYNEVFVLGQAAWAGAKYFPQEKVKKNIDTSIEFINNIGYVIKNVDTKPKRENVTSNGEELLNIVKYLDSLAESQNIKTRPLWLSRIKDFIRIEDLAQKYNYSKVPFIINPIIGEYDIPSNQEQKLLTLPLTNEGNTLVYGASGSGKENFVTTLIYSSMLYYTPQELNYYIIDFGSGTLNMFKDCTLVGDIVTSADEDKLYNLYKMITDEIEKRKELFSDYNGDYLNYCENSGSIVPSIVVIINNYETYEELCNKYEEQLIKLTRECNKYGIYFVITVNTPNGLRFKLKQNFSLIYALQQNNDDDFTSILGNVRKNYPSKVFGRGIIRIDDIYEFQTALVTEKDNINKYVKEKSKEYSLKYNIKAKSIPILPKTVKYKDIASELGKTSDLIIGIDKKDLEICKFDFDKNYTSIVTSLDIALTSGLINPLANQILENNSKLFIINADDYMIESNIKSSAQYIDKKFDDVFTSLLEFTKKQNEIYVENNYDKSIFKDIRPIYCIIIGVDNLKNRLNNDNKSKFQDLFINAKDLGIMNFILVDSIDKIKKIELESWYKTCVNNNCGIWIGNGINDQFSLKINQKNEYMREDVPNNFCFVVNKGKAVYVKYVEEFDLNAK